MMKPCKLHAQYEMSFAVASQQAIYFDVHGQRRRLVIGEGLLLETRRWPPLLLTQQQ